VEVVKETGPPTGVTVVGVRIFGGDREVFVTDASGGAGGQRRLRVGDEVAGYTVKTIEATSVTLSSPSGDLVTMPLTLEKGKGGGGGGGASPPVARAPGRPQAPQPPGSPAAGAQGKSPAAGVARTPPPSVAVPPAPPVATPPGVVPPKPGQNPQTQHLPSEVRQKLERLRRDRNPRMGAEKPNS
jgi:hypothetical protein